MAEPALFADSKKPHVLVIDDDDRIRDLLSRYLKEHGFIVATARDAANADEILKRAFFDVLIVDVMMPGRTGLEFTENLRKSSDIPILLLTALGEAGDRISGLETGADDYLAKPFEPKELLLRLKAILRRRPEKLDAKAGFHLGKWFYDSTLKELQHADEVIRLTSVEGNLLEILATQAGRILSREELARLCGLDGNDRTIDVQVTRLRRKIEDDSRAPRYLQTIRGQGYMLRVEKES
ncbi:MAG: DNA-binding response regulator [Micavibrio aeruginosavorus]|uniref:DNA-binding response regulator n=1 Tax=Micavibrio aeruginosavorus TaxID=349221 RepID=A0A2W5HH31_9BACT|nr:MAG: DNA-binding response regulator [Micavibrio aeruginosavorus]